MVDKFCLKTVREKRRKQNRAGRSYGGAGGTSPEKDD